MRESVVHPLDPVFNENSEILILGSFPSVASRKQNFFYGHPRNRFWKVLAALFEQEVPQTIEEKKAFLLKNHIAVWDVIHSCEITGSSDASIRNVVPNDLSLILNKAPIRKIYANGTTAKRLYDRYCQNETGREAVLLPSSSPANAACDLDKLIGIWRKAIIE
ncbi:MAG: DNA-deoxyinosine glycosylase [Erysipelotrichaceae bacterium]|nr:DNA-deoxyinosine glycosylase [Erysipelotrichaceae bacterium]